MPKREELGGQRFGRLIVNEYLGSLNGSSTWSCLCDCGVAKPVAAGNLKAGRQLSCGCHRKELASRPGRNQKHGGWRTPEYQVWVGMRQRCRDPNSTAFRHYGGRGIKVCPRWDVDDHGLSGFTNFLADMGKRPLGSSLDRIDVNGDYEPDNCRWATDYQQATNRRSSKLTPTDVGVIRQRIANGASRKRIADDYGLHPAYVGQIVRLERHAI